jgi:hypothetical protein
MLNLDNQNDFRKAIQAALDLGFTDVISLNRRKSGDVLLKRLGSPFCLGQFRYRRFHLELLKRAYGLPFINQQKVNYANQIS